MWIRIRIRIRKTGLWSYICLLCTRTITHTHNNTHNLTQLYADHGQDTLSKDASSNE
jgi:hypothetical protein